MSLESKCEVCLTEQATQECTWGVDNDGKARTRTEPYNKAKLCDKCAMELYESMKGSINAGFTNWINKKL